MYSAPSLQGPVASSSTARRDRDLLHQIQDIKRPLELHENYAEEEDDFYEEDPSEDGDDRFFNPALLSHIAVRLRDKVPRGTHVKGSIPYPRAFTGKDIVVCVFYTPRLLLLTLSIVHDPISNPTRAATDTRYLDKRPQSGIAGRSQSAEPALLL